MTDSEVIMALRPVAGWVLRGSGLRLGVPRRLPPAQRKVGLEGASVIVPFPELGTDAMGLPSGWVFNAEGIQEIQVGRFGEKGESLRVKVVLVGGEERVAWVFRN